MASSVPDPHAPPDLTTLDFNVILLNELPDIKGSIAALFSAHSCIHPEQPYYQLIFELLTAVHGPLERLARYLHRARLKRLHPPDLENPSPHSDPYHDDADMIP